MSKTWTLKDRQGKVQKYTCEFIPAGEAFDLSAQLMAMGGPLIAAQGGAADAVGRGMAALAVGILQNGGVSKVQEILSLSECRRNGKAVGQSTEFDVAYTGNLGEQAMALRTVLDHNYGDFLATGFGFLSQEDQDELAKAKAAKAKVKAQSTQQPKVYEPLH